LAHASTVAAAEGAAQQALKAASEMVRLSGASGGICAVIGSPDAELPLALSKQGRFVVHCLSRDAAGRDAIRKAVRPRGMYGTVSATTWDGRRLPYTDNLVNIIVVNDYPALQARGFSAAEILRALAPLGTAYVAISPGTKAGGPWMATFKSDLRASGITDLGAVMKGGAWLTFRKPWPADIDEWGHYLHGADGNPVARDRVVGPPTRYQWTSGPTWMKSHESDSSISTFVTARGRLFAISDEAPTSLVGPHDLPDKWFLTARDAFNGVPLWKVPIPRWGWREWKPSWFNTRPGDVPLNIQKRLVAVGDKVYVTLGYRAPVSQLDAATGEILQTYEGTNPTGEILHTGGTLVVSVLAGEKVKVAAVDAKTGKRLWITDKAYRGSTVDYIKWKAMRGASQPAKLDPSLNIAADGKSVALIDGPDVVCLDAKTGAERWRATFPQAAADKTAGGIKSGGNLWVGTMIVTGGVVIHATPNALAAMDAKTGKVLWTQPKKYIGHLWYEWKDVFVIDGVVWTWTANLERSKLERGGGHGRKGRPQTSLYPRQVVGYDLRTGRATKTVELGFIFKSHHHHRCYRNKATLRYILASRRGTEFVDLTGKQHTVHNWVRGICHVGMMPANGLQYAPPHPCRCYNDEKLTGMNALAGERRSEVEGSRLKEPPRLTRGPAFGGNSQSALRRGSGQAIHTPQSTDWPTFRADAARTGSVATDLPDGMTPLWRVKAGRSISPPIAVGDRLYVSLVDEHHVACLDAASGKAIWEVPTGARVDSPPTYHAGTLLFGSADGAVYCVRAADGELVWRFRAAPGQRLIGVDGQLESAWPVHGSVLVHEGKAYVAAGRSSQLDGGIDVFALDAATGKLLHRAKLEGPDYATNTDGAITMARGADTLTGKTSGPFGENYVLPMGVRSDIMLADGTGIHMRTVTFDAELNRKAGKPAMVPAGGFLDGNYFKRMPWTLGGQYGRLIVHDKRSVYYVRMFDSLAGLDPSVYFTPAAKGYLLFSRGAGGKGDRWSGRVPIRIRAMVLAGGRLVVAGPPDVVDPRDPLGAFEGRKGGLLYVMDAATGKKLAEHAMKSPPVFNGAAAARGRLFITSEDGSVTCFGKR